MKRRIEDTATVTTGIGTSWTWVGHGRTLGTTVRRLRPTSTIGTRRSGCDKPNQAQREVSGRVGTEPSTTNNTESHLVTPDSVFI